MSPGFVAVASYLVRTESPTSPLRESHISHVIIGLSARMNINLSSEITITFSSLVTVNLFNRININFCLYMQLSTRYPRSFEILTQRRMVVSYRRFGTTYRSNLQRSSSPLFLECLIFEDGTDRLTRNVGNKLPFHAA